MEKSETQDIYYGKLFGYVQQGKLEKVKKFFEWSKQNKKDPFVTFKETTLLCEATGYKQAKIVEYLLENNANINETSGCKTPLMIAAFQGSLEIVKILHSYKACLDSINCHHYTPLHFATVKHSCNDCKQVAHYLLEKGARFDVPNKEGKTAYNFIQDLKWFDLVELINKKEADNPRLLVVD